MKFLSIAAVASFVALSACAPSTGTDMATVADAFVGKSLAAENGTVFKFNSDGTLGGTMRGETIVGTYAADSTEICSAYTAPSFLAGQEFCSVPEYDGNSVVFNRRDDSQSQRYTIQG